MKFGMSTWFFQEYSVSDALKKIASAGFSVAEIWMEHLLKTSEDPYILRKEAEELSLAMTLHATSYDINITSVNIGIRKESEKQAFDAISAGRKLGAEIVVLHPGRLSSSRGSVDECLDTLFNVFRMVDTWAVDENVFVGIEAMEKRAREVYIYPEDINNFMSQGWKNIKLTFDIAHAYTVMKPYEYLKIINKDWIGHVHLSDGNEGHTHLPLGEGNIDVVETLNYLNSFYSGNVVIEGYIPGRGYETALSNYKYLLENGFL